MWLGGRQNLDPTIPGTTFMLLTNIPTDLIYEIFLMLDDHRILAAFIRTNRLLYEIFKAYSNAILRQVLCNAIDMDIQVLPYAWAAIKSQQGLETEKIMKGDIQPQEYLITRLTRSKIWDLYTAHETVQHLAKLYSVRFKEGRIRCDTLTAEESRRFHIAAHLFIHYQTIWRAFQEYALQIVDGDYYSDSQSSGEETREIDAREDVVQDAITTQICDGFLDTLSTDELLWIQEFSDFLLHDIDCTLDLEDKPPSLDRMRRYTRKFVLDLSLDSWRHYLLSKPLENVGSWADVLRDYAPGPTHLQQKELWLKDAMSRVLQARAFRTGAKEEQSQKILMSKGILVPACQKCGYRPETQEFINKTNLEAFTRHWVSANFPGEMAFNLVETGRARIRVHGVPGSRSHYTSLWMDRFVVIKEIMAQAEAQAASLLENGEVSANGLMPLDDEGQSDHPDVKTAVAGYKWSPDDVLCESCFIENFEKLYYAWWLEERQTDRVEAHEFSDEPCWWGNECRMQRNGDHASRRDHCFPRTKRVGFDEI